MSASRKPRTVTKVEPYINSNNLKRCVVYVEDESGKVSKVPLHDLTRPELAKAAAMAFPSLPGNIWLRFKSEDIQRLVRENDLAAAEAAAVEVKSAASSAQAIGEAFGATSVETPKVYWSKEEIEGETPEAPKPAAANDPAAQLAELIGQLTGGVDPEEIRAIVEAEVKRQVVELGVTRIEVNIPEVGVSELPEQSHQVLAKVIKAAAAGCNVFLVGPAGSGKSTIAHQAAQALGIAFHALSLGPTTPTSKLFGYMDASGNYVRTPFREAYEHGGVILLDELDNGHPGLVAEINQATANGYCAFADGMVKRHEDCRIFATGNTFGRGPDRLFVGRNILDAATLDRFVTIEVLIDERLESSLARAYKGGEATDSQIEDWIGYVLQIRRKVEEHKLPVVVSPRATIEGAKLLHCGFDLAEVKEYRLFAGIDSTTRSKLGV